MKTFLLKAKHFFKRNIYPITVTMCTVLVLTIITISAYSTIKGNNDVINTGNPNTNIGGEIVDPKPGGSDDNKPTSGNDPIIFGLPFENAEITKEYTDSSLLYDKTSTYWVTHQALDFACNEGTLARAVADGTVTKVVSSMMDGSTVYLKISDELTVVYKGLAAEIKVKEGDKVKKGDELGKIIGFMNEKKDGTHLHLELLKGETLIDPTDYFAFNK